ncbi:hypothetical protein SAMD00023353_6200390 [Rosellinia necatrix]|uniref:Uncharacterized protein n=1 Tax=Rosellinia necatrix TaxID=77044 RepID=A0A1W2TSF6_ROSNE|nr:hypothetical protein SAMD00023353_6200390 [Rosellinia necatrix]
MEASAPKRRKTSPTASVPVHDSDETVSSDSLVRRARLNRPSFASPTKASLARSNPDILQRRTPSRGDQFNEVATAPAASEPASPTSRGSSVNEVVAAQAEDGSGAERLQKKNKVGNGKTNVGRTTSPVRRVAGGLSLRPRRTSSKPSPRPLPPPSAEEEELIDPFKGRKLRRSPPPGVLPAVEPEEPELPPTPTQKGLSNPASLVTSPPGIHNTPSKRPRRSRILAARINSSPLKQPPFRPPELDQDAAEEPTPPRPAKEKLRSEPRRKRKRRKPHPARQVEEVDPLADKKALRDSLLSEVARLEADLAIAARENERLQKQQQQQQKQQQQHAQQGSRHHHHAVLELPDSEEQSRLLDVLRRHALPPEKEAAAPDAVQDWLAAAALNPIALLPFGAAHAVAPPPLAAPGVDSAEETERAPPTSHHPVSMTAGEELPYLQVFTPLTFTSTVTTIQPDVGDDDDDDGRTATTTTTLQRHAISVASSPPGLFAAVVDMLVDARTLAVARLAVPRLDPAAVGELGPFLAGILDGNDNNNDNVNSKNGDVGNGQDSATPTPTPTPTRNVAVATWAMGEWVRLATRRARFWCALRRELGSRAAVARCAAEMRAARGRRKGRGRGGGEDDEDDGDGDRGGKMRRPPPLADVVALMGRTSFDLDLSGADNDDDDDGEGELTARILWRIEFDWTGEARSKIALLLAAPAKWHASDGKGSLAGLPDMFDKLLRERKDPLEAVKIIVALVVGDGPM